MKVRKITRSGRISFQLDAGRIEGKRLRLYFTSREAALTKLAQLRADRKQVGDSWTEMPAQERAEAIRVIHEIKSAQLTVRHVWDAYRAGKRVELSTTGRHLGDAIKDAIEAKRAANRRESYVKELDRYLRKFAEGREAMDVSVFNSETIERWLADKQLSPHGRATAINRLSTLFDFCWRKKWISENPCLRLERVALEYGVPQILPVAECERLMRAAQAYDAKLIPRLALMMFAGVRRDEVSRLSWKDVDLATGKLTISAAASKVRYRRIVNIPENCVAWLKLGGELPGLKNLRRRMDSIRAHAKIREWPHDVLRHTAASHMVPRLGVAKTVELLGHSEAILHRHYRELVTEADNSKFWAIMP